MDDPQAVAELVRRCVAGEAAAWEELVRTYQRRIYNYCYRFTGSAEEAEDLAQDVFIKIYRSLETWDASRGAFTTWMITLTRNLLVDQYRRGKYDRMTDSLEAGAGPEEEGISLGEQIPDRDPSPDARVDSREVQEAVHRALEKLSPELREAVILRDLQDLDYKEIAHILRVPEGTVKSRINRGRTELARLLSRTYGQVT